MRSLFIAFIISAVGLVSPANAQAPAAVPSQVDKVQNPVLKKEVRALEEAAALMEAVSDEESAKKASVKIRNLFRSLPPPHQRFPSRSRIMGSCTKSLQRPDVAYH